MTNNLITLLITLVCFICFYNSLENGFVHDDIFAIVNNKDILPNTSVWNIFYNDFWGRTLIDSKSHKSFRPLCTLTFRFDYMVFGLNPFGYHLVNVLLHILVCNVLFQVLRDIVLFDTKLSLMATILFATHPVHVEAVTGVVGRADVLSCLFVLLAFKAYHKYLATTQKDVFFTSDLLIAVAYGTSTFFIKEHSVMIFFVLIGYDALHNKQCVASMFTGGIHSSTKHMQTRFFKRIGLLLVWFLALFRYRMHLMNYTLPKFKLEDNPASFSPHLQTRILTYLYLLIFNLKLLLSPNVLCYDWQIGSIPLVDTLSDIRNLETLFGLSFLVITGVNLLTWVFKRQSKEDSYDNHALAIGLFFLVIPFLPASNFFIRVGFVVAERILYIPSVGYTILVVVGLNRLCQKFPQFKNTFYFTFGMAVVLFTSKTISYNRVWKTRETLFRAGVHTLPHNAKAHYNYANFLKDENRTEQAVYHYKKAVELYPPHSSSHNNLGTLLQNDQPGVAEYHFNEAIKHTPGHYRAMFNIAHIYRSRGEYEKACDILKTCLSLKPTYFDAKLLLADSLNELGRAAESIKLYQTLYKEHQDNYQVNHNFAAILQKQGYQKEAINIYSNLLTKDPKNENILNKLATVYKKAGNNEMAVTLYQRAILAHPKSSKAYQNLALLYYERREFQKSRDLYEKLMQISPNAEHKRNYAIVLFALREHREAIRLVDGNIQEQPSDMQSHHLLINFLVDTQEYQKGKVAIERALKISPGDQRVLLFKANILRNTKSYAEAIKIYRHLIHKNGRNMDALINLGTIYHIQDCSENLVLYKFAIMRRFLMEVCFLFSIMAENLVLGSLPCYICGSKKSLEDCEERQTLVPGCEGNLRNESTCYIFESVSSEGVISVGKNCMKSSMCNEKNGCHGGGKLCKVYCCNTPGCNKSSRSYVKRGNWILVTIFLLLLTYLFAG